MDKVFLAAFKRAFPRERCIKCGQADYWLRPRAGAEPGRETFEDVDPICEFCIRRELGISPAAKVRPGVWNCSECGRVTKKGRRMCLGCYWKANELRGRRRR